MTYAPTIEPLALPTAWTGRSPLTRRQSLRLLGAVAVTVLATFGLTALVIVTVPGARSIGLALLGIAVPLGAALVLVVLHVGLHRAGTGWRALGFVRPTARILHLLWQIPVIFTVLIAVQGLVFLVSGDEPVATGGGIHALLGDADPLLAVSLALGICFLTPIWEEAAFRGIIHGGLRHRFGPVVASVLSGTAFAIMHGVPILLPYMLVLGLALAFLREFHRTLWAPVLMHTVLNSLVTAGVLVAALS